MQTWQAKPCTHSHAVACTRPCADAGARIHARRCTQTQVCAHARTARAWAHTTHSSAGLEPRAAHELSSAPGRAACCVYTNSGAPCTDRASRSRPALALSFSCNAACSMQLTPLMQHVAQPACHSQRTRGTQNAQSAPRTVPSRVCADTPRHGRAASCRCACRQRDANATSTSSPCGAAVQCRLVAACGRHGVQGGRHTHMVPVVHDQMVP